MINRFSNLFIRSYRNKKLYSIISLLSLSLSIGISILIYLFIKYELSFDRFHQNAREIYRVDTNLYMPNMKNTTWRLPSLSDPLITRIRSEIPGVLKSTRFMRSLRKEIIHTENKTFSEKLTYVDNDFFSMFSFELIKGNVQNVFDDHSSMIITESIAIKYFGNSDPINQTITIEEFEQTKTYTIKGVIKNPPSNSSIQFELLVPLESYQYYSEYQSSWNEHNYSFFIQLSRNVDDKDLVTNLQKLAEASKGFVVINKEDSFELSVTPLTRIHWNTEIPWEKSGNYQNIKVLTGIALIVITMACSNFISLSLVNSTKRRIEIGIKKLVGSSRRDIAFQFIGESIIFTFISAILSFILVILVLPFFSNVTGINQPIEFNFIDILFVFALVLSVGILAGFYPAYVLSSFKPAEILKSITVLKIKYTLVSILVFVQAIFSFFLGYSSLIMSRQMNYLNLKDLGFNHEHIIVLPTFTSGEDVSRVIKAFKNAAEYEPDIQKVTAISNPFFEGISSMGFIGKDGEMKSSKAYAVDYDFIETLELKIEEGRNFDVKNQTESNAVIINQKLAKEISDFPIGKDFIWGKSQSAQIIGVVKDFHFKSLESSIEPLFLTINNDVIKPSVLLIKVKTKNIKKTLIRIEDIYKKTNPNKPFEFKFLSDTVQNQYKSYKMWTSIIQFSNLFALFIACIGLFGLAGVDALNKYKEIGVRKVFGASSIQILLRVSRKYIFLMLTASILASCFSHIIMSNWLSNFAYRINIDWELYLFGAVIGFVILVISIGYHVVTAARTNPSDTLKHEG
jgi:putative ABC transport system permease protein